jgi:hypothetical protein
MSSLSSQSLLMEGTDGYVRSACSSSTPMPLTGVTRHLGTKPHTAPAQPRVRSSDFKCQRNRPPNHIQHISTTFFKPGTAIAIDECMVRFLGRSLETTTVPSKPISTGFKVWAVAQRGYFFGGSGTGRAGSSGLQVSDTPTGDCLHNHVANGSNGGFESHRVLCT